jgi:hypothetical protein
VRNIERGCAETEDLREHVVGARSGAFWIATGALCVCVQIMPKQQAARIGPIALDVTKVWAHRKYPRIDVGE